MPGRGGSSSKRSSEATRQDQIPKGGAILTCRPPLLCPAGILVCGRQVDSVRPASHTTDDRPACMEPCPQLLVPYTIAQSEVAHHLARGDSQTGRTELLDYRFGLRPAKATVEPVETICYVVYPSGYPLLLQPPGEEWPSGHHSRIGRVQHSRICEGRVLGVYLPGLDRRERQVGKLAGSSCSAARRPSLLTRRACRFILLKNSIEY